MLGYWLWADTTGTGTPDAFNDAKAVDIGFVPAQGLFKDTTVYWQLESDLFLPWAHWTTYFAYKIVARPDAATTDAPPVAQQTFYFSQNSDPIDVYQIMVGSEEYTSAPERASFRMYPNPFPQRTKMVYSLPEALHVTLCVYNSLGQLVHTVCDEVKPAGTHSLEFNGAVLPPGGYFCTFETPEYEKSERLIRVR